MRSRELGLALMVDVLMTAEADIAVSTVRRIGSEL